MKNVLKKKHSNSQKEWLEVWNNYQDYRTKDEVESLIQKTVSEIKSICKNKRPAYAWSGGKDSIALQIVCEDAGIRKGFCCYNDLYFSRSIEFFKNNHPDGIELFNSGEDIAWLSKHPDMLFPKVVHKWSERTHLRYQPIYCKKENIDILMMGKRRQDMNFVSNNIVNKSKDGVNIYCPIRNWTHEDVICAIRYRNKQLSPVYFTEDGFHYGDTKFAIMNPQKGETLKDAWIRIYKIEPKKLIDSAKAGLPQAFETLEEIYGKDSL